jgi:hypothetical protein
MPFDNGKVFGFTFYFVVVVVVVVVVRIVKLRLFSAFISRSSTTFSAQMTPCFRYLASHFKTKPTETVHSLLG